MFGPRLSTIFASRWKALWWSAGIMLTAYCSVPGAEKPGDASKAADIDVPQLVGKHGKMHHKHANPWAATPARN